MRREGEVSAGQLGRMAGTVRGSEQSATLGGSTDDNLIGSFSEGAGFGSGGDSIEVSSVLSWQPLSQLSLAQATPLSHLTCLRRSLYSLSRWVLPAKRGKVRQMKLRSAQMVLRGSGGCEGQCCKN